MMTPRRKTVSDADDRLATVKRYYRALDGHAYDELTAIFTPDVVHRRPDQRLAGRDRLVEFFRSDRPQTDTSHPIDAYYTQADGEEIAARGRLLTADGSLLTGFVDIFTFEGSRIATIETYVPD